MNQPAPAADQPCVLTIGNFDGVHRGHQSLLRAARGLADEHTLPLVVMTFHPEPRAVLQPHMPRQPLMHRLDRGMALLEYGADRVQVIAPTPELLGQVPEQFVRRHIVKEARAVHVVEGPDFCFGRARAGTVETLQQLAPECGFRMHIVPITSLDRSSSARAERISSSRIRQLLAAGAWGEAVACLGHPYRLRGVVRRGAQRGRQLGWPTANLELDRPVLAADGVYAAIATVPSSNDASVPMPLCKLPPALADGPLLDRRHMRTRWSSAIGSHQGWAAVSIGRRPTAAPDDPPTIEAHLLDFDGDLYDRPLVLDLTHRLRDMQKFDSLDALAKQIGDDVARVRAL